MTKLLAGRMSRCALIITAIALAGCGGTKPDKGTGPDGTGGGSGATNGGGSGSSAVAVDNPITLEQCDVMMEHILDIGVSEMPADKRPTPEKVAEIKAKPLTDKDKEQCGAFAKSNYDCIMAATTTQAMGSCEPE